MRKQGLGELKLEAPMFRGSFREDSDASEISLGGGAPGENPRAWGVGVGGMGPRHPAGPKPLRLLGVGLVAWELKLLHLKA